MLTQKPIDGSRGRIVNKGSIGGLVGLAALLRGERCYRAGKRMHEFDEANLDVCYQVSIKGSFFGSQEAIKQMLAQGDGGVIVDLVSTAGLQGRPNQSVYNISKGAQANFTRCAAIKYGKDGIRVNGICPPTRRPR